MSHPTRAGLFICFSMAWCACTSLADQRHAQDSYLLSGTAAELYERFLVPPLFAPWADDLTSRAHITAGHRVLDIACGTGVVARRAVAIVGPTGRVAGVDINPGMLATARATSTGLPIEWHEGDALQLPFADASFDVVLCQQGLQFFADRSHAVREMHRVLAPGGRVAVSVWRGVEHNPYGNAVAHAVEKHVGAAEASETRSPFAREISEQIGRRLQEAGFRGVQSETVDLNMSVESLERLVRIDLTAYPTTGTIVAKWPPSRMSALVDEAVAELRPYRTTAAWLIPFEAQVAVGTK